MWTHVQIGFNSKQAGAVLIFAKKNLVVLLLVKQVRLLFSYKNYYLYTGLKMLNTS